MKKEYTVQLELPIILLNEWKVWDKLDTQRPLVLDGKAYRVAKVQMYSDASIVTVRLEYIEDVK